MKEVAQAIKVFPKQEEPPSSENAAVLVPLETLQAILKGLKSLNQEVKDLKDRVESLEALEEIYHGPDPQPEDIPLLRKTWETRREVLASLPSRVSAIEDDLSILEKSVHKDAPKAPGKKTIARIEKLKDILKCHGGSRTFKQLQDEMGLNPSQFSQMVSKLDKRIFETFSRPGGKRGEKVLKLKVRIKEGLLAKGEFT